ncbi:MAG: hypothetical protein LBC85_09590 [Fibromonadaceae bacterium]|jgi:hypothetical protein|nr:hypothetical protein [Fibromonadaceae bacterium]
MTKKSFILGKVAIIFACLVVTAMFVACDNKNGDDDDNGNVSNTKHSFQLKIYQGYNFKEKRVYTYDSASFPVDFSFSLSGPNYFAYLFASKIRKFDEPPTNLTREQVDGWDYYILGPLTGYYVLRSSQDESRHYLIKLINWANSGQAEANWILTFEGQEITVK